jgi:hypothetical protein
LTQAARSKGRRSPALGRALGARGEEFQAEPQRARQTESTTRSGHQGAIAAVRERDGTLAVTLFYDESRSFTMR